MKNEMSARYSLRSVLRGFLGRAASAQDVGDGSIPANTLKSAEKKASTNKLRVSVCRASGLVLTAHPYTTLKFQPTTAL